MNKRNFEKLSLEQIADKFNISQTEAEIYKLKSELRAEIQSLADETGITHQEIADSSGVPRSSVTGIISGSLSKVSIERLIRIAGALGKKIELRLRDSA